MLISVIVTAFNRKDFLRTAVRSVLDQTLEQDLFEIIVVKNFEDQEIDSLSSKGNIVIIQAGDETIGQYMSLGIARAKGEVIAFLDDDDVYLPKRLECIHSVFSSEPDLLYYKNDWQLVDVVGKAGSESDTLSQGESGSVEVFGLKDALTIVDRQFRWNMSCIAVRKKIFDDFVEYVPKINAAVDLAVFYMAASLNGKFAHDLRILSQYRRHEHSMSKRKGVENDSFREYRSLSGLRDHIKGELLLEDFTKSISKLRILSIWDGSNTDKREVRTLFRTIFRLRRYSFTDLGLLGFIFVVMCAINLFGISSISALRKLIDPIWKYEKSLQV